MSCKVSGSKQSGILEAVYHRCLTGNVDNFAKEIFSLWECPYVPWFPFRTRNKRPCQYGTLILFLNGTLKFLSIDKKFHQPLCSASYMCFEFLRLRQWTAFLHILLRGRRVNKSGQKSGIVWPQILKMRRWWAGHSTWRSTPALLSTTRSARIREE